MMFDDKNFLKEINAVKKHGGFGDSLSAAEKQTMKQSITRAISSPAAQTVPLAWNEKYHSLLRYAVSIIVGISLVGGTSLAANGSVPGDALYPVKRVKEKVELALATSEEAKVNLEANFAQNRLDELHALSGKFKPTNPENNPQQGSTTLPAASINAAATSTANATTAPAVIRREDSQGDSGTQLEVKAEADAKEQVDSALSGLKRLHDKFKSKGQDQAAEAIQANIVKLQNRALLENLKIENRDNASTTIGSPKDEGKDTGPGERNSGRGDEGVKLNIAPQATTTIQLNASTTLPHFKVNVGGSESDAGSDDGPQDHD